MNESPHVPSWLIILLGVALRTPLRAARLAQWGRQYDLRWSSIGGMALGIYFFHKCMEVLAA
jgi:hypothetical protein